MELSTEILGNIGKTIISIEFTTKHVVICHDDPLDHWMLTRHEKLMTSPSCFVSLLIRILRWDIRWWLALTTGVKVNKYFDIAFGRDLRHLTRIKGTSDTGQSHFIQPLLRLIKTSTAKTNFATVKGKPMLAKYPFTASNPESKPYVKGNFSYRIY